MLECLLFFCAVTKQMERLFPLIYGKDYTTKGSKSEADDGKGAIAKSIQKNNYWQIVELEVCKLNAFNNGLEGVKNTNAIEVLTVFNLYLANS